MAEFKKLKKEEVDNGLYIQSLGTNTSQIDLGDNMRGTKYSLHVDTSEGSIDTNFYFNLSLPYIKLLLVPYFLLPCMHSYVNLFLLI